MRIFDEAIVVQLSGLSGSGCQALDPLREGVDHVAAIDLDEGRKPRAFRDDDSSDIHATFFIDSLNGDQQRSAQESFDALAGSLINMFEFENGGDARKLLLDPATGLPQ